MVWDRAHRQAVLQRHRLAGHAHRQRSASELWRAKGGQDRFRAQDRPAAGDLLLRAARSSGSWTTSPACASAAERGEALFGNIDTWLIWNLTGGANGGAHVTDVTNASRTLLMNLHTLDWDDEILTHPGHPAPDAARDPSVQRSRTCTATALGQEVPVCGDLGDQQAALVGQTCFRRRRGQEHLRHRLLHAAEHRRPLAVPSKTRTADHRGYKLGDAAGGLCAGRLDRHHRRAGAVAARQPGTSSTSARQSRTTPARCRIAAASTSCPAFSGLFAPYWQSDARGVIVGLTRFVNKGHICRAALEATAYQTREVLDAMEQDSGVQLTALKVDGGMVSQQRC